MKQETIELIAALLEVIPSDRNVGVNTTVDDAGESISIYISPAEKAGVELSPLERPKGWVPILHKEAKNHLGEKCRFRYYDSNFEGVITENPVGSILVTNVTDQSNHGVVFALSAVTLVTRHGVESKHIFDLQIEV